MTNNNERQEACHICNGKSDCIDQLDCAVMEQIVLRDKALNQPEIETLHVEGLKHSGIVVTHNGETECFVRKEDYDALKNQPTPDEIIAAIEGEKLTPSPIGSYNYSERNNMVSDHNEGMNKAIKIIKGMKR